MGEGQLARLLVAARGNVGGGGSEGAARGFVASFTSRPRQGHVLESKAPIGARG